MTPLPTNDKKQYQDEVRDFREVRYMINRNGTKNLIVRIGKETIISLPYIEKIIESYEEREEKNHR